MIGKAVNTQGRQRPKKAHDSARAHALQTHRKNVAGFIVPAPTSLLCGIHTTQPPASAQ
jgi:hypothetical protein